MNPELDLAAVFAASPPLEKLLKARATGEDYYNVSFSYRYSAHVREAAKKLSVPENAIDEILKPEIEDADFLRARAERAALIERSRLAERKSDLARWKTATFRDDDVEAGLAATEAAPSPFYRELCGAVDVVEKERAAADADAAVFGKEAISAANALLEYGVVDGEPTRPLSVRARKEVAELLATRDALICARNTRRRDATDRARSALSRYRERVREEDVLVAIMRRAIARTERRRARCVERWEGVDASLAEPTEAREESEESDDDDD